MFGKVASILRSGDEWRVYPDTPLEEYRLAAEEGRLAFVEGADTSYKSADEWCRLYQAPDLGEPVASLQALSDSEIIGRLINDGLPSRHAKQIVREARPMWRAAVALERALADTVAAYRGGCSVEAVLLLLARASRIERRAIGEDPSVRELASRLFLVQRRV